MKLSHLSLAIFAAISLAACGGSNNDQVNPESKPEQKPKPEAETPVVAEENDQLVDPTLSEVVSHFRLAEASSQGTTQYLRNDESEFDRILNPKKPASATAILGVDLNNQNPWFTNFVAARTKFSKEGKAVTVAQYLGTNKTGTSGLNDDDSLQSENEKNIRRIGGFTNNTDDNSVVVPQASKADVKAALTELKTDFTTYVGKLKDLKANASATPEQKAAIDEAIAAANAKYAELQSLLNEAGSKAEYITLTARDDSDVKAINERYVIWGDGVESDDNDDSKAAVGLVGLNFAEQDENGDIQDHTVLKEVQGTDDEAISSSRIFGRYFLADDEPNNKKAQQRIQDGYYNSYRKATTYADVIDGEATAPSDLSDLDNDLKTEFKSTIHSLAVEPMELVNVQYGRVTGQLDPVDESDVTEEQFKVGGNTIEKGEDYLGSKNENAVNYYFYRGTNATTIDEMAALPSDATFVYEGHALMYGIDNRFHGNGDNLPNSFGDTGSKGLGNFVYAQYDVGQQKVGGWVYNAWQLDPNSAELTNDKLVEFGGDVTGNSVIGAAKLSYKAGANADFRASFFGDRAQELGGSFNSTTYQEKYGPGAGNEIWGGVFGAQRIEAAPAKEAGTTIDNSWLGDIGAAVRK